VAKTSDSSLNGGGHEMSLGNVLVSDKVNLKIVRWRIALRLLKGGLEAGAALKLHNSQFS